MTTDRELSVSRLINAPIELVWEVWTNADHIKHWWGPKGFTNSIELMDVRIGGAWVFVMHGPDGTDYKNKHIFKEIVKHEKIVLEHVTSPKYEMQVSFETNGTKTLLTIRSVFGSAEQLKKVIEVFHADKGLVENVDKLEIYLANII